MALQTAVLQPGVALGTVSAPLYTVPFTHSGWVKRAVFTNVGAVSVNLTVTVTRAGGAALTIISVQPIAPNTAYVSPELSSLALATGDGVAAFASVGGVVNAFLSGLTA